jgi:hypothetical protein
MGCPIGHIKASQSFVDANAGTQINQCVTCGSIGQPACEGIPDGGCAVNLGLIPDPVRPQLVGIIIILATTAWTQQIANLRSCMSSMTQQTAGLRSCLSSLARPTADQCCKKITHCPWIYSRAERTSN